MTTAARTHPAPPTPRRRGGARPSSTRSTRAASPTPTATASATCPASPRGCDYLAALGIDAVWLSPFYPSALADGGYDVADYRDVDPRLGTLEDFDAMVERAARRTASGSSSTSCPTTPPTSTRGSRRRSRAGPARPARERYIFRDGTRRRRELAADRLGVDVRRLRLGAGRRRPVVPPPLRRRAARPQLGQPRGPRGLRARRCGSGPTAASTASASTSPTC